jgi:CubicO group peptidase (beta-lactamase class C family)
MAPLYDLLRTTELASDPGSTWMYSNLGYGLLGEALARRAGLSYGDLVRRRITAPLRMRDTALTLTPAMAARRADPHLEDLSPGPEWNKPWARGAGGLKSTIADLAAYVSAYAGLTRSPLAPAMAATRSVLRPSPLLGGEWGLGWQVLPGGGHPIATHSGIGTGFSSCLAFDPATRTGVAVLSNERLPVTELGFHILRPSLPLAAPPPEPGAPNADLDRFVGRFTLDVPLPTQRLPAGAVIEITRGPSGLLIQIPGAPRGPLTRTDATHFAITDFPVGVEFREDGAGLTLTIARVSAAATRAR